MNTLQCPTCDGPVDLGHRSHRGLLTNALAALGSHLVIAREQLEKARPQRLNPKGIVTFLNLEAQIIRDEAALTELKKLNEECYG